MHDRGWRNLLRLCMATKDEKLLSELLSLFLTPEEKSSIETRCLIVESLLDNKLTQRKLSEELKVSIAKITRGSNELKRVSPELKEFLQDNLSNV